MTHYDVGSPTKLIALGYLQVELGLEWLSIATSPHANLQEMSRRFPHPKGKTEECSLPPIRVARDCFQRTNSLGG